MSALGDHLLISGFVQYGTWQKPDKGEGPQAGGRGESHCMASTLG